MDTQILEAINYVRNVSKKKVTVDKIATYLNNVGASNWDKESVEANMKEMQTKGIITENYKRLHCHQILPIFQSCRMMFVLHLR